MIRTKLFAIITGFIMTMLSITAFASIANTTDIGPPAIGTRTTNAVELATFNLDSEMVSDIYLFRPDINRTTIVINTSATLHFQQVVMLHQGNVNDKVAWIPTRTIQVVNDVEAINDAPATPGYDVATIEIAWPVQERTTLALAFSSFSMNHEPG